MNVKDIVDFVDFEDFGDIVYQAGAGTWGKRLGFPMFHARPYRPGSTWRSSCTSRTSWTSSTSWTSWTSCTRRGPGLGASRQHPLFGGGADRPGSATLSNQRSGEPPCSPAAADMYMMCDKGRVRDIRERWEMSMCKRCMMKFRWIDEVNGFSMDDRKDGWICRCVIGV